MLDQIRHIDPATITDLDSFGALLKLLLNIVEQQSQENEELRQQNADLRDEINRLKGEQGRPKFPKAKWGANRDISSQKRRVKRSDKGARKKRCIAIDRIEYCGVDRAMLPADAQFKGYIDLIQQDLRLVRQNTCYRVERYYSASQGKVYRGKLPQDYVGAYGAGLQSLLQGLHHVCDVTHGRLKALVASQGIILSSGTLSNILLRGEAWVCEEQRSILRTGIGHSPYTQIDSTSSKEKGRHKSTQVIGGDHFRVFYTLKGKSRQELLHVLQGKPHTGLLLRLNEQSRSLLKHLGVGQADQAWLEQHLGSHRSYSLAEFEAYLQVHAPHIKAKKNIYRYMVDSLALGHYHQQEDFPVIDWLLSDDAPEYQKLARFAQALCWVHDGRFYNKLNPKIDIHRQILADFQATYWQFYHQLLEFKELQPPQQATRKIALQQLFENIFKTRTHYFQLNQCIQRTYANKAKLLAVLDNPALPLHNNASELGARRVVRKRDISLHTCSEKGTRMRDAFMSIVETAAKLQVNALQYIADRITQSYQMPPLAELVRKAYA